MTLPHRPQATAYLKVSAHHSRFVKTVVDGDFRFDTT